MASFTKLDPAIKNAIVDSVGSELGANAVLKLYGAPMIASFAEAITTQPLLSTHACSATFAPPASGGSATVNAIANGTGTAAATSGGIAAVFGILETSGGARKVVFSVGATGCDMNMTPDSIIKTNQTVIIDSFTIASSN